MFFVIGIGLGGFHSRADRVGIFRRKKEYWTVVTEFTAMVPNKLEKQERTASIQPCQRLSPRTVDFVIAAVRTASQSKSTQRGQLLVLVVHL